LGRLAGPEVNVSISFSFFISLLYMSGGPAALELPAWLLRRDDSLNGCAGKKNIPSSLFLPTPVRIAGPFQKFILNIFQAVDLFKTFAT
jgi:hypothetical protein